MNMNDQIAIIEAHRAGKRVLQTHKNNSLPDGQAEYPLAKGEIEFDFANYDYRIEPRRVECFAYLDTSDATKLANSDTKVVAARLTSRPVAIGRDEVAIRITFLEP